MNVYSQELTPETETVSKAADTGVTYYGVRMFLASPDLLHHKPGDDDRSALTFWIPNARGFGPEDLAKVFDDLARRVRECPVVPRND